MYTSICTYLHYMARWVILTQDRDVRIDAKMKLETSLLQAGCGHGFFSWC